MSSLSVSHRLLDDLLPLPTSDRCVPAHAALCAGHAAAGPACHCCRGPAAQAGAAQTHGQVSTPYTHTHEYLHARKHGHTSSVSKAARYPMCQHLIGLLETSLLSVTEQHFKSFDYSSKMQHLGFIMYQMGLRTIWSWLKAALWRS